MPRPVKVRRVCGLPHTPEFGPIKHRRKMQKEEPVILSVDEYEVIRLIDYEGLNQQETCQQMNIARTTVQAIYSQGRKKLAQMLVESRDLRIGGGTYRLCNGNYICIHGKCMRRDQMMEEEAFKLCAVGKNKLPVDKREKENVSTMEIIIPVNKDSKDANISASFGRAEFYLIYNEQNDDYKFIANPAAEQAGSAGVKAAQLIVDTGSRILLTPRCGMKAGKVLGAAGFKIYQTEGEDLQENLKKYKNGDLKILEELSPGRHGGK